MKLSDMIISAIIKKGILCEARNINVDFNIPAEQSERVMTLDEQHLFKKTIVHVEAEHITVRFDKEEA